MSAVITSRQLADKLGCRFTFIDAEVRAGRLKPRLVAGRRVFTSAQIEAARKILQDKRKGRNSKRSVRRGKETSKKKGTKRLEKV